MAPFFMGNRNFQKRRSPMGQMQNPRKRFSFISDTSHGWLLVTPGDLRAAGITEADITPYSYRDITGEMIALEEDSDAHTFLRAWEKLIGAPAEIEDSTDNLKSVRCWPSFGTKDATAVGQGA
jgi:hypothetical protein